MSDSQAGPSTAEKHDVQYVQYTDERDMPMLQRLIDSELSEPYSVFTYRHFLHPWPSLCYFCHVDGQPAGVVVCKIDDHRGTMRGYLGMLVVQKEHRKLGIGSALVRIVINEMIKEGVEEVSLEAETCNDGALRLYERLGFIRDKRLQRYYLSGQDAFRLKLRIPASRPQADAPETQDAGHTNRAVTAAA